MEKHILFLLKPGFYDEKGGPFFCPSCSAVEGFLKYAPEIEARLGVRRIDFKRPRKEIVDLIGASNQKCPVLVLVDAADLPPEAAKSAETGKAFISGSTEICDFLGRTFNVVRPHP
jgi:hypothetical protein